MHRNAHNFTIIKHSFLILQHKLWANKIPQQFQIELKFFVSFFNNSVISLPIQLKLRWWDQKTMNKSHCLSVSWNVPKSIQDIQWTYWIISGRFKVAFIISRELLFISGWNECLDKPGLDQPKYTLIKFRIILFSFELFYSVMNYFIQLWIILFIFELFYLSLNYFIRVWIFLFAFELFY